MLLTFSLLIAVSIDLILGEPRRWHPLVGFGNAANWLENKLNNFQLISPFIIQIRGLFAWMFLILPIVLVLYWLEQEQLATEIQLLIDVICLTFAIGIKSLIQHARAVANALNSADISLARKKIAMMVSRDTSTSDEQAVTSAAIESVLENGSDAIFAAFFWFVVFGAPGVILYRLANTLDAMWGYRNERYNSFGWAAARIDDVLNYFPARLTALSYAIAGNVNMAISCWKKQAKSWQGINPGAVMASGAGALNIKLGGTAIYHGKKVVRPQLGCGNRAYASDIDRAIRLIYKSIFIWLLLIAVGDYLFV